MARASFIPKLGHLLVRGETVIASVGIATAVILLATMGAAAWWALQSQRDMLAFARQAQVRALSGVLARSAESMLAQEELSAVRRLLIDARHEHDLLYCRIRLPDERIIADTEPAKIVLATLPRSWPAGAIEAPPAPSDEGPIVFYQPLNVNGRGWAMLELAALRSSQTQQMWEVQRGIGLIGAAGLTALWLVYRQVRNRVATLGLIRESLLAFNSGETARDVLALHPEQSVEAKAWNHLLDESEHLRKRVASEGAKSALTLRSQVTSDLDQAYDALSVGLVILDEGSRIKQVNGAAAVMMNWQRDDVVGVALGSVLPEGKLRDWIGEAILASGMQRKSSEAEHGMPDTRGVLRFRVRPLRRGEGPGALVMIEDVTQQRSADLARNAFIEQATHELRTPLTNMRLYLEEAIEGGESDPAKLAQSLNVLSQETRRLERMVGEMLSVAEIEAGSLKIVKDDVRLDKLLGDVETEFQPQAKSKDIQLRFQLPPKLPVLQADRDKLVLLLHNVIGNALKYTPKGGKVTVLLGLETSRVVFEVRDTGFGIKEDEQELIFQRFYRAKDPRVATIVGSGLGLALAREVARLHGGDITVESQVDKGSNFVVALPIGSKAS